MRIKESFTFVIILSIAIIYHLLFSTSVYLEVFSHDSKVFQAMGMSILQGHMPYVDMFDHKGIILYWINAIGIWIMPQGYGLLVLCIICMTITLLLWLKTCTIFVSDWRRWMPMLIGILLLIVCIADGNMTEMWSLPFISYAIYLLARNIKNHYINKWHENILLGIGMGIVIFIRPNNLIPIAWYSLMYVVTCVVLSKYKQAFLSFSVIGIGLLFTIAIILWLYSLCYNDIFSLIYGTFLFNMKYATSIGGQFHIKTLFAPYLILFTCLLITLFLVHKLINGNEEIKDKRGEFVLWTYVIGAYVLTVYTMSKAYLDHYFIVIIPIFVLILIKPFTRCRKKPILITTIFCVLFGAVSAGYGYYNTSIIDQKIDRFVRNNQHLKELDDYVATIPTEERNDIWNYTGRFVCINALLHNQIIQRNRIILPFQLNIDKQLREIGSIQENEPKWLVINPSRPWITKEDSIYVYSNYTKKYSSSIIANERVVFFRHK